MNIITQMVGPVVMLTAVGCLMCGTVKDKPKGKFVGEGSSEFADFLNSLELVECHIKPELTGKHPRLFFTAQDVPRLRQQATTSHAWFINDIIRHNDRKKYELPVPQTLEQLHNLESESMYSWGWWRLMAANILYLTKGDPYYREVAKKWVLTYCSYEHWGFATPRIDELGPSDLMSGVAGTYDILYDEFTPKERKIIRRAIMKNMEILYDKSFLMKAGQYYWQRDFQNNHHWNRIHSLLIASAAIYGDDPEEDSRKYLNYAYSQCRELVRWLPEDGTCHEGPGYWAFGHKWLIRAFDVLNRVTGENYFQQHPYYKNAMYYKIYLTTSNIKNSLYFGDGGPGLGGGLYVFYRMAGEFNNGHFQYFADRLKEYRDKDVRGFENTLFEPQWAYLWYDATVKPQPLTDLPLGCYFPDLDLFSIRSGWDDDATVMAIKCGPPGGYHLNDMRFKKVGKDKWASVAHDHPDQNHFIFYSQGEYWADDDGYPKRSKSTSSHNTLLVDGKGQPNDNLGWYQPFEMEKTGFCRDLWFAGNSALFAGDASRCYEGVDHYVRYAAFINGRYLVLLDDIRGKGKHDYELRFHNRGTWTKEKENFFKVKGRNGWMGLRVLTPDGIASEFLPADRNTTAKPSLALTVKQQEKARVISMLVPGGADASRLERAVLEQEQGALVISAPGKATDDLLVYRQEESASPFKGQEITGDFSALLAVKDKKNNQYTVLLAMNCSHLEIKGAPYLVSPVKINYCRQVVGQEIIVDLGHRFKEPGTALQVHLGGFTKNKGFEVATGQETVKAASDGKGVLALTVDLTEKRQYQFK